MKMFRSGNKPGFRENKQMHPAVCSKCGKKCEVPFKPTGDKPIYCQDCFRASRSFDERGGERRETGRGDKRMFQATCVKCGNVCEVPFRPTGGKPVYCSNCFEKSGGRTNDKFNSRSGDRDRSHIEFKQQFETLNSKLDQLLELLMPVKETKETKETTKRKPAVKKSVKKPAAKKKTTKKKK